MSKCARCGNEISGDQIYVVNDKEYCEECAMKMEAGNNPPRKCGQK